MTRRPTGYANEDLKNLAPKSQSQPSCTESIKEAFKDEERNSRFLGRFKVNKPAVTSHVFTPDSNMLIFPLQEVRCILRSVHSPKAAGPEYRGTSGMYRQLAGVLVMKAATVPSSRPQKGQPERTEVTTELCRVSRDGAFS